MERLGRAAATTAIAALLAFAMRCTAAPVGWWWLLVPTLCVAIAFARPATNGKSRVAFRRGWLFGTLFILADLAWVIGPATAHLGPVLLAIAVVLAALEGLPIAIAAWAFARTDERSPLGYCLGVPALYALLELARASGPLGLPLATLGATQTEGPFAVTMAAGSVPLATFVSLAFAATIVWTIRAVRDGRFDPVKSRAAFVLESVVVIALVVGSQMWHGALAARPRAPIARVGIVEAGPIDVGRTFSESAADYAAATQRLPRDVDYALWPEGVLFLTAPDHDRQRAIAVRAAKTFGKPILVGATIPVPGSKNPHNDLLSIDPAGNVTSVYTKQRLVPFGEYQPFAIGPSNRASYDAGTSNLSAPVRLGTLTPFGALICYEVAFAELTRTAASAGAGYLVAVLNDTWFAGTDGPDQLAQLLQGRAIESGIAIARADAVPPSGLVDADGTWVGGAMRADGVRVFEIPPGIVTPFRRSGPAPSVIAIGLVALVTLWGALLRRRS